jgi:phosphopantetheinyl transferase
LFEMSALGFSVGDLPDGAPESGARDVIFAPGCEYSHWYQPEEPEPGGVNPAYLWETPILSVRPENPMVCCRAEWDESVNVPALTEWALCAAEREHWMAMRAVEKRRREWLLGRCVAKQAVRHLLKKHLGANVPQAAIQIDPDPYGRPRAIGAWTSELRAEPSISIAHSDGTAVALAALDSGQLVGIDLENLKQRREDFEIIAFRPEERQLLTALLPELRQEWALRMWCAKEAVGKALGRGLSAGLLAFEVTGADTGTGRIPVKLRDGALKQFPWLGGKSLVAHTTRQADFVFATIICQRGAVS